MRGMLLVKVVCESDGLCKYIYFIRKARLASHGCSAVPSGHHSRPAAGKPTHQLGSIPRDDTFASDPVSQKEAPSTEPRLRHKNKHENECPQWRRISFQTDKNRYYT